MHRDHVRLACLGTDHPIYGEWVDIILYLKKVLKNHLASSYFNRTKHPAFILPNVEKNLLKWPFSAD